MTDDKNDRVAPVPGRTSRSAQLKAARRPSMGLGNVMLGAGIGTVGLYFGAFMMAWGLEQVGLKLNSIAFLFGLEVLVAGLAFYGVRVKHSEVCVGIFVSQVFTTIPITWLLHRAIEFYSQHLHIPLGG